MHRKIVVIKGKYIVWFGLPSLILVVFFLTQFAVYMTKAHPRKSEGVVPSTPAVIAVPAPAPAERENTDSAAATNPVAARLGPNPVDNAAVTSAPPVASVLDEVTRTAPSVPLPARRKIVEPQVSDYLGSSWTIPLSEGGWSEFTLKDGANTVYVSSSEGSDKTLGKDGAPVKTLRRGVELLRKDHGDRLMLKRGDSWEESFGNWTKSGESAEYPMIVGAYGTGPRPRIVTGEQVGLGIQTKRGPAIRFLVLKELDFVAARSGPDKPGTAIGCVGEADHILIEDCRFTGYTVNLVFQVHEGRAISNLTIRRCIVLDSHSSKSHSQGLFCKEVAGLTVEECVFDHNGWSGAYPETVPTMFNHNVYIQTGGRDVLFRNNISARASSHGIQARCGGLVADNLFFECPLAILFGGGQRPIPGPVSGRISGNVMLNGNDIADAPRGNAIEVNNLDSEKVTVIADNIAAHVKSKRDGFAVMLDSLPGRDEYAGIHNVLMRDNIAHDWGMPLRLVGTDFSGTLIAGNRFTVSNAKSPLVEFFLAEWTTPGTVEFSANRYASNLATKGAWFAGLPPDKKGAWRAGFDEWAEKTGETGTVEEISYVDPGRDLSSYAKSIGLDESPGAFLEAVRNREGGTWPAAHTAAAAIAYIREGFTPRTK